MSGAGSAAVLIQDVTHRFGDGAAAVTALEHLTLHIDEGEFVCVVGASGCGKSTLLSLVGRRPIERPPPDPGYRRLGVHDLPPGRRATGACGRRPGPSSRPWASS